MATQLAYTDLVDLPEPVLATYLDVIHTANERASKEARRAR